MFTTRTVTLLFIVVVSACSGVAPTTGPASRAEAEPPAITTPADRPLTADEADIVSEALSRFAEVGLELPAVEISFHDDDVHCNGHHGIFRSNGNDLRIDVCVLDRGNFYSEMERTRTLVHELAHAWDHAHLDNDGHDELLDVVEADVWHSPDVAWGERGAERFAETIVWGLYDQRNRPILIDTHCSKLHADFVAITGAAALGPVEKVCEPDATA